MYGSSSVQEEVTVITNATNLEKEANRAKGKEAELDARINNIATVNGLGKRGSYDTAEIFNDY
jgi:lipopolysaccharide export system protein LptA